MDLFEPWFIVGGFALGFVLLWLGNWLERRSGVAAAVCFALCGVAFSETSLYWLSAGTGSNVPQFLWIAFPVAFAAFVVWRGWRQRTWIARIPGSADRQTFGVLPHLGRGVPLNHPDPGPVRTTIEFDQQGHRVLGIEYSITPRREDEQFAEVAKVAEQIDSIYSAVELRIPAVPALTISPKTGAFEPEHFTPLEDARITRNAFGWLRPDTGLETFEVDAEFDRRFSVTTSDPKFAAAALTDEVRALILGDLWFRVHEVAFHGDATWTTESGGLTEDRMFGSSRRLAMLVAAVPAPVWEVWGGDRGFASVTTGSDTSYVAWNGGRGGAVRTPVNRFREAADRQPVTSVSLTTRTTIALALVLAGLLPIVNSLSALVGVAPETQLSVLEAHEGFAGNCSSRSASCTGSNDWVRGTYVLDGETHDVSTEWIDTLPAKGAVVDVEIGPLWWHPVLESSLAAVVTLLIGLLPLLAGAMLAKATYRPRPPRRVRKLRRAQEATVT
ncbi:hypothetical protein [Amycolatopsis sp. DSM 110486]|uniref:hypothetical protein n=1 Tax=Amycolatopsis sp. DSM 110486 TaxID=2865832 RepID=UPI001C694DB9|nr:hypothetical protein [Amycolatopsis sp. DSM 110486]QYN24841.1 hypothetical protein K1T34_21840 [Amycolatopsis sp. DSM 110486]